VSDTHTTNLETAQRDLNQARANYHITIVQAHNNGMSLRAIAAVLDVSHQTVANIINANR
jgi:transposase-like protein